MIGVAGTVMVAMALALGNVPVQDGGATGTVEVHQVDEATTTTSTTSTATSPTTTPVTAAEAEAEVEVETTTRQGVPLPRTGAALAGLMAAGLALLALGASIHRRSAGVRSGDHQITGTS